MRGSIRLVPVPLLVFAALLLTLGATAQAAAPIIGISQSYRDFGLKTTRSQSYEASHDVTKSASWRDVGATDLRVIVPWDIALRPTSDGIRREFENWLGRVRGSDVKAEPYVVFGPTNSAANLANPSQATHRTSPDGPVAPFAGDYRTAIARFLQTWGPKTLAGIRIIGAWNEPNLGSIDMSIPNGYDGPIFLPKNGGATTTPMSDTGRCGSGATTSNCGPLMAAYYWKYATEEMNAACSGSGKSCYVVAGEFASAPDHKTYWASYADKLVSIWGSLRPEIISFHAHRDAEPLGVHTNPAKSIDHDCRPGNEKWCVTANFYKWLKGRGGFWADRNQLRIWDTEVGAEHAGGYYIADPGWEQRHRFEQLLAMSEKYRVKRIYYFNFQTAGETDRGLVDQGSTVYTGTRPIWDKLKALNCGSGCSGPRAIPAVVTPEEPYEEPELPAGEPEDEPLPPAVETEAAANVSQAKAELRGTVSPSGAPTTYHFEYGTTTVYGLSTSDVTVSGSVATPVAATVGGLLLGTTYHYRLVASNSAGTSLGADQTFTTAPASTPAVVTDGVARWIYYRGVNGNLWQRGWNGSGWSAWDMGTPMLGSPAVVSQGSNRYVYFRGTDNHLYQWSWNEGKWGLWDTGNMIAGDPSAVVDGAARFVYFRGFEGQIWQFGWNGATWALWAMGDYTTDDPIAMTQGSQRFIYFRGTDGDLWQRQWSGSAWGVWDTGNPMVGEPSAITDGTTRSIYFRGTEGQIWQFRWNGSTWGMEAVGGSAVGEPIAIQQGSERFVYFRGSNGHMWQAAWNGGGAWGVWDMGPSAGGDAGVVLHNGVRYIYHGTANGNIWQLSWSSAGWGYWDMGGM